MPPVSILDHPGTAKQLWPLSVDAYHALGEAGLIPEKTELLYGFVFHKMPKSPLHSFLTQLLFGLLMKLCPPGYTVRQEQPITSPDSEPEPDIALVRGTHEDFRHTHPSTAELVIEISVSSKEYDRDKIAAHASAGVKEFWIVLAVEQQIEIYRDPMGSGYRHQLVVRAEDTATSSVLPSLSVKPTDILKS